MNYYKNEEHEKRMSLALALQRRDPQHSELPHSQDRGQGDRERIRTLPHQAVQQPLLAPGDYFASLLHHQLELLLFRAGYSSPCREHSLKLVYHCCDDDFPLHLQQVLPTVMDPLLRGFTLHGPARLPQPLGGSRHSRLTERL